MSDLTAKMHGMASFNIAALIRQFDNSADTTVTGSLSSLLGEIILLEALSHSLTADGHTVKMLPGRPIRDDTAFGANHPRPRVRDLDAWLLLDDSQLVAVECKHRTAASIDGATVPDEPEQLTAYARRRWTTLKTDHIDTDEWTDDNKVYLPLRPPESLDMAAAARAMPQMRRVLAIWRPISCDGISFKSEATSTSVSNDQLVPATAEVFSASLYLRFLRDRGETRLPSRLGLAEKLLKAVDELTEP
jgi:hypothetical protein